VSCDILMIEPAALIECRQHLRPRRAAAVVRTR
jgi:hypothetical protein